MAITLKAGDRLPVATFAIARADGAALGFSADDIDSITIIGRKKGAAAPAFQSEVTDFEVTDGGNRIEGEYAWGEGETDEPGQYHLEVRVIVAGVPITFPNDQHETLMIAPRLFEEGG